MYYQTPKMINKWSFKRLLFYFIVFVDELDFSKVKHISPSYEQNK